MDFSNFNLEELINSPVFHIGMGLLGQQQQPGEGPLAGLGRGMQQGMQTYGAVQQMLQKKQGLELRKKLAESIRNQSPAPRPLAFNPEPGDAERLRQYQENQVLADSIMAGGNLDAYFARQMQRETREDQQQARRELAEANRNDQMTRHRESLEERRLQRESIEAHRNASLQQALALRQLAAGNVQPVQIVDPESGNVTYVHPSQAYGKQVPPKAGSLNLNNEQKRQSAMAALDFADQELARLDQMVQQNPRTVGPSGIIKRGLETAKGFVIPDAQTPAIDVRNEQMNILATIRKRISDSNASNRDINQALEIIGGGLMTTPGATSRSISTLREQLREQRNALGRVGGTPSPTASGGGGLSPAEQAELDALRRWKAGKK